MNCVKYLTICLWNCASCRVTLLFSNHSILLTMTAPAPVPNYSCLHSQFLPMSKTFLHNLRPFPRFPIGSLWLPTPARISFLLPSPEMPSLFTGPSPLRKKATTMNSSGSSGNNVNPMPTFWRPKWSPSANYPAKMCPLFIGHSVISQAKLIPTMPCAMSSSSPHSSKGWPILSFGGKSEKPNQQWWKMHLVWHLKCNLIWTSTANSPTLPRRLLTNNLTAPSPSQSELFSDLIFTIKEEVKRVVDERSGPPQRGRSGERPTTSRSQQSESNNHTNRSQRRTWNQNQRNRTNSRGNTPNRGQSNDSKNRVSFNNSGTNSAEECQRCHRKNHETKDCKACFKCGCVGHTLRSRY